MSFRHGQRRDAPAAGFTLLEVLVVLLIMGLLVGLASAIVQPDERGVLELEAERLAQLLELAAVESRFTGDTVAWTVDDTGYGFWRLGKDDRWTPIQDLDSLRARQLPNGVRITSLEVEGHPSARPMRLEFSPVGREYAFHIEMSLGGEQYAVAAPPVGEIHVLAVTEVGGVR